MSDNTVVIGNKTFQAVPCSCRCGGSWAWVEVEDGKHTMIGCVCHHTLPVNAPDSRLGVVGPITMIKHIDDWTSNDKCNCYSIAGDSMNCPVHERYGV
jgi:hypothetical protein